MYHDKTIGVAIPAHNEALSIAQVVKDLLTLESIVDHIVVCDNASTDATRTLADNAGAIVVHEPEKGYGAACLRALETLPEVDWIVFIDGDGAMRASELTQLLNALDKGAQLVIGSRTLGERRGLLEHGALTSHQKWGNWLAARLLNAIWRRKSGDVVTDLGPFRAISRKDLEQLNMQDRAYGWTVEMQAKALDTGLLVREVPVSSLRRLGKSKISGTWRGSLGASVGILSTLFKIGLPALWAQLQQSINIGSNRKDSLWKKPS